MAASCQTLLDDAAFHPIARWVCWFKSAEETLARPDDFLCRVMALGF